MLVKIKEIQLKCIFICHAKILVPIYATYIIVYRLHFWFKFSPTQGIQTINYRFFHLFFTPLELKIKLSTPTLYRHTDRCTDANDCIYMPPSDPIQLPIQKQLKHD